LRCQPSRFAPANRLVRNHLAAEADRAERPAGGAECRADLVVSRGARGAAECGGKLVRLEPVVAAHEREDNGAVVFRDRHRLRGRSGIDAEKLCERLAGGDPGRRDLLGLVEEIRELRRARDRASDLDVRGKVAVLARDEGVLTGACGCEEVD
jgi:hypothetical protein